MRPTGMPPQTARLHSPATGSATHTTPPPWTQGGAVEQRPQPHIRHHPHIHTPVYYRPERPNITAILTLSLTASGMSFLLLLLTIFSLAIFAREGTDADILTPAAPLIVWQAINIGCIIQVAMRRAPSLLVANAALSLSSFLNYSFYEINLSSLQNAAHSIQSTIIMLTLALPWTTAGAVAIFEKRSHHHSRSSVAASGAAAAALITQLHSMATTKIIESLCPSRTHHLGDSCTTAEIFSLKHGAIPAMIIIVSTAVLAMVARRRNLNRIRAGMVTLIILVIADVITHQMLESYTSQPLPSLFSSIPLIGLAAAVFLPSFREWVSRGGQLPPHTAPPGVQTPPPVARAD